MTHGRRALLIEERLHRGADMAGRAGVATGEIGMRFADGALLLPEPAAEELDALSEFMGAPVEAGERGTLLIDGRLLTASMLRDLEL